MNPKVKKWLLIALAWVVIAAGIVLMPLPGPGILIVAGGAALLMRQSERARKQAARGKRLLHKHWPEGYRKLERALEKGRRQRRRVRGLLH